LKNPWTHGKIEIIHWHVGVLSFNNNFRAMIFSHPLRNLCCEKIKYPLCFTFSLTFCISLEGVFGLLLIQIFKLVQKFQFPNFMENFSLYPPIPHLALSFKCTYTSGAQLYSCAQLYNFPTRT
jgi:hypothetical protein